ncbi:gliding motility-associated C-terminal domain-containing protein [Maribacter sp. 2-571]|uniref:T9SS type B sorting domain-containing protein n=1 Tax=Maribacter sp. 2-571 TaxID=3417569 RepID=UPI003D32EF4E
MGAITFLKRAATASACSKYLILCFCILFGYTVSGQINNPDFRVGVSSNDLGPCGGANNAFSFLNILSKTDQNNSFEISFTLPDGVSYIPGTEEIRNQEGSGDFTLTVDDTDPNAPIFTLERPGNANWQTSDRVQFRFLKTADCDAVQFSYNGGLFKDAHTVSYVNASGAQTDSDTDPTINSYNFLSPLLSILNYSNSTATNGQTITKPIEITNSGNGNTQLFYHTVTVDPDLNASYELRFNGTTLTPNSVSGNVFYYSIDFSAAPFLGNVGDGDSSFEETEVVALEERFVVAGCGSLSITHQSEWGCSTSEICQVTSPVSALVNVSQEGPDLNIRELTTFGRIDLVNGATYLAQMVNEGTVPAFDVVLNTGFGTYNTISLSSTENGLWGNDGPQPHKLLSNFIFTDTGNPMPIVRLPHTQNANRGLGSYAVVNDSDHGMPGVDPDGPGGFEDLDGDGFFDDLAPGAIVNYSFDFDFDPNTPNCPIVSTDVVRDWSVRSQGISRNQCGDEFGADRAYFNDGRFRISPLTVTNPSDIFDGQSFNVNLLTNLGVSGRDAPFCNLRSFFTPDPDTSLEVEMTVPNGVTLAAGAGPEFSMAGPNTVRFLTTDMPDTETLRENILFPLEYSCGSSATGPVDFQYTVRYSGPCLSMVLYCGTISATAICPGNCDGPSINAFDAERITAGWTDDTMTTKTVLDPAIHATNFYAARDEMLITALGEVNNISVDNLSFDITYRTPGPAAGGSDLFEFLPTTDPLAPNKSELLINGSAFDITTMPTVITEGSNNYRIRFDLSAFASSFDPGDQLELRLKFLWADSFNDRTVHTLDNFRGEYFYFDGGGAKVACLSLGDEASYLKVSAFVQTGGSNGSGCTPFNDQSRLGAHTNSSIDHFPNEFRPSVVFVSATTTLPQNTTLANDNITFIGFPGTPSVPNGRLSYSQTGNQVTVTPNTDFRHRRIQGNVMFFLRVPVLGNIDTPDSGTNSYEITYQEYAYSDYPLTRVRTQTKNFSHEKPIFSVTSPNPVISGNQSNITYEMEVCGTTTSTIPNNWLQLGTATNFTVSEAVLFSGGVETPIPFTQDASNTWIEIGEYSNGPTQCKTIRFTGTFSECSSFDIPVSNSWDCAAYPVDAAAYATATYIPQLTLRLEPQSATLQLLITEQPTTSVDVCTDFNIGLEMRNADAGDLIDPYITFDIPGDVSGVLINDIQVEYPRGSGDVQSVSSTLAGNQVTVNILDHTTIAAEQGIKGASNAANLDEQIAIINLNLNLRCDFTSNTAITYTAFGNNTCGVPAEGNGTRLSTDPLVLNGAESSYSTATTITTPNGGVFQGCDPFTVSVQTVIVDNGPTSNEDIARIVLPDGLRFIPGSLNSSAFISVTNPVITVVDDHEEMTVNMPVGADNGDFILYEFDVALKNEPNVCAVDVPITIANFEVSSALSCGGVSCSSSETLVGSSSTDVTLEKSIITAFGTPEAIVGTRANGDSTFDVSFGVENTSAIALPAGAQYTVYCSDAIGNITGPAIHTGALAQSVPGNANVTETFSFDSPDACSATGNIVIAFTPSASNCHCGPLDIIVPVQDRVSDLELDMTSDLQPADVGELVTFTLTLDNIGPFDAPNVSLESIVPSGFTVVSIQNGGVQSGNAITWSLPEITNGETLTFTFTATADTPTNTAGEYSFISEVTASEAGDPDSTVDNYDPGRPIEDDESLLVMQVLSEETDIRVVKTADVLEAAINQTVVFTITAENLGPDEATNIGIDETLPNGFQLILGNASVGTYDQSTGQWDIAALAPGETAELELTVTVVAGDDYTNTASLAFVEQLDIDTTNDSSSVTITVIDGGNIGTEQDCLTVFNEFSPNNDGTNDVFFIECIEDYPDNLLQVFNRWGTKVYERSNYDNTWDGTSEGRATINITEKLPVGTYYYVLDLADGNPVKTGWIYISR